jgi:hypothetical protein
MQQLQYHFDPFWIYKSALGDSLTGGKLTRIYFLHLLYTIYYPVTTHP